MLKIRLKRICRRETTLSSKYELTYNDNTVNGTTPEKGRTAFHIVDLTAGNLVATQALLATLLTSIQAIVLGELNRERIILSDTLSSSSAANSPLAQRENKWLVTYEDATTHFLYRGELPTADLSLLSGNSEFLDLTAGPGQAFKNAFEAVVKSRANNAVTVVSVKFVGRKV